MSNQSAGRVAIVWRGEAATSESGAHPRLRPMFEALEAAGVAPLWCVFADERADQVRRQLLEFDGVLVWVDPLMGATDRAVLDGVLREVSAAGVWVSADPSVIQKMGTKEVLVRTRDLAFGSDSALYRTLDELTVQFPARLAAGPRVLKPLRGNGGLGVWKVQAATPFAGVLADADLVNLQDAAPRTNTVETITLSELMRRCEPCFADSGCMIDQPFQPRISDGMIRCYFVGSDVVGFARQEPDAAQATEGNVFGLPSGKTMFAPDEPQYARLKRQVESDWLPALTAAVDVDPGQLPMLWDADFLFGPKSAAGVDTYVLCEINVSCVIPFPPDAPAALARTVAARLASRRL